MSELSGKQRKMDRNRDRETDGEKGEVNILLTVPFFFFLPPGKSFWLSRDIHIKNVTVMVLMNLFAGLQWRDRLGGTAGEGEGGTN